MTRKTQSDKLDEILITITRLEEHQKNMSVNMEEMKLNNSERNKAQDMCITEIRKIMGLSNGDSKNMNSMLGRLTNLETQQYGQALVLKCLVIGLGLASTLIGIIARIRGVI